MFTFQTDAKKLDNLQQLILKAKLLVTASNFQYKAKDHLTHRRL
jgi:hypothetical protein